MVATNEGSYGRGPASDQLLEMVRLNAAAVGVDVIHAAVTGHSTFVFADGSRAGAETGLFTAEVLYGTVRVQESRRTLYAMTGDWLELAAIAGGGGGPGGGLAQSPRVPHPAPRPALSRPARRGGVNGI